MVYNIFNIGALTSKTYQFSYRFWEVESNQAFDFFDSFGTSVYIEVFNFSIIRIVPKVENKYNLFNNFITDRIRFYFDSLDNNILDSCFIIRRRRGNCFYVSWQSVYKYFQFFNCLSIKRKYNFINYLYGQELDLFMLYNLRVFFFCFLFKFFKSYFFYYLNYFNFDFLGNFFFTEINTWINKYDYIYVYMYNIRCEHPLLYVYMRFFLRKKKIFFFGISYFIGNFKVLGISLKDLIFFFYKNNFFFRRKLMSLFLIGSGLVNRFDFFYYNLLMLKLKRIFFKYLCIFDIKYSIFNLFDLNCLYFGLVNSFMDKVDNINSSYVYFYNGYNIFYNVVYLVDMMYEYYMLNIYLNNYYFPVSILRRYDILLPVSHLYENESYNINIFAKKCFNFYIYRVNPNSRYINDINLYMFIQNDKNLLKKTYFLDIYKYLYVLLKISLFDIFYFFKLYYNKDKCFDFYFCKYKYQDIYVSVDIFNFEYIKLKNINIYMYVINNYYILFKNSIKSLNLLMAYNLVFNKVKYYYYLLI